MIGRVRVRAYNWNTQDKSLLPTTELIWAYPVMPFHSASVYPLVAAGPQGGGATTGSSAPITTNGGVGFSPTGILVGSTVFGFYLDGLEAQRPVVMGTIPSWTPVNPSQTSTIDQINLTTGGQGLFFRDIPTFSVGQDTFLIEYYLDEPHTAFQGRYPYIKSYNSEQGMHFIVDDTPQHALLRIAHQPSGTYSEISQTGRRVDKTTGDQWSLALGNNNIRIGGNQSILIGENKIEQVDKDSTLEVGGTYDIETEGTITMFSNKEVDISTVGCFNVDTDGCITLNSKGPLVFSSDISITMLAPMITETGGAAGQVSNIPLPTFSFIDGGQF